MLAFTELQYGTISGLLFGHKTVIMIWQVIWTSTSFLKNKVMRMNILWTYAADIKKIVSGLREMIESGHLSLRWQFSSQTAGKGLVPPGSASWKFAQEY